MFGLIMIVSFLCCFEMIESSYNYLVHDGVNINPNVVASLIINSMRKENPIFCLAVCNYNKECLSSVYIESVANDNCILYNQQFDSNETASSTTTKIPTTSTTTLTTTSKTPIISFAAI